MKFRQNKPLRDFGIYKLRNQTLVLCKRSEVLAFLFTPKTWNRHGPVDYRVSHGAIYRYGHSTGMTDEDLVDTGETANSPSFSILLNRRKQ